MTLNHPLMDVAATSLLAWIGQAILFGTLLAAMTWLLLRLVGRRLSPAMHAVFWLIVLVKFIMPVGPGWNYSLASALSTASRTYDRLLAAPQATAKAADGVAATVVVDSTHDAASPTAAAAAESPRRLDIASLLALVYLAVIIAVASLRLTCYCRFANRARRQPSADESVRGIVLAACRRLGVLRIPDVRISPDAPAPFVLGLSRPVLVLSPRQLVRPDELEAVILHEVAHLRRGDLFVRGIQGLAGTLLFFWPVVAWVNRRIDLARETACDEWALRHGRLSAGAYARCLLQAMHPRRTGGWAYRPAAMAANLSTVERRIEMILNSPVQSRRLAVGLPLAFAALAWAGFVLTGVARADDPQPQAADQPEHIFVEAEADDAGEVDIKIIKGEQAGPGKLLWAEEAGRPERLKVHMRRLGVPSEQELAEFLTAHPTADANADGKLIHAERSAFLAALAMHDPSGVIQQFPNADNNGDGQLSEEEAAQLVTGGMFMRRIEGPRTAEGVKMAQEDVVIARFERRKGDAKPLLERTTNPNDAATWLLANVVYAPAATEVAQYVEVVEAAPFAAMLKRRPEADTDGDGKLSPAEREAFFKLDRQHVDAMLLKHFPEADTNGDGVLSPDEIKAIKGNRVIVKHKQNADGTDSESVRVNGAEGGHEVFIIKTEEKETSDK